MKNHVRRGEHGVRPFHAHHLRELRYILRREEKQQGVEVHTHHALLEDVAGLAGYDVANRQLVGVIIDR